MGTTQQPNPARSISFRDKANLDHALDQAERFHGGNLSRYINQLIREDMNK